MQVSAISSNQGFTARQRNRENIDRVISLDDNQLRALAYIKTFEKNRKRQKNVNRLYNSVPIVAALSAGILTKKAGLFTKELTGFAAKTVNGIKAGGNWAFLLGTAAAIGAGSQALSKNSESVKDFKQNHPLLTLGTQIAAFCAAAIYLPKGAAKLYNMIKPECIAKAGKGVENIAEHINKLKAPQFMRNWGANISNHIPESIKNIGKTITAYAPYITMGTAVFASLKANVGSVQDFNNTYFGLKERQHQLAQARLNELKNID